MFRWIKTRYRRSSFAIGTACVVSVIILYQLQDTNSEHRKELYNTKDFNNFKFNPDINNNNNEVDYNNYKYGNIADNKHELDQAFSDLDVIKKNLIIMRKYLQANSNYSSKGHVTTNLEDIFKNPDQYLKSKQFVEDNADTFIQIADYILKSGYIQNHNQDQDPELRRVASGSQDNQDHIIDEDNQNMKELQKNSIKNWEPFYVNFEDTQSKVYTSSQKKLYEYGKRKLEDWDLFYAKFPDEQSQDVFLKNFQLSEEIVNNLSNTLAKYEANRVPKKLNRPRKLDVYDPSEKETWKIFHQHINQYELYNPEDPIFKQVIKEMNTLPFTDVYEPTGGTQQKLVFYLQNNLRMIFKPMRFPRKQESLPDHMFWRDYERHFAEIAAFHLDKVLGFHRVPPTIGRYINVTSEIQELDVHHELIFFRSPAGNRCFYGHCEYYCDTAHAVCGRPEMMEGSLMMYLPTSKYAPRISWRHPWRRTYSKTTKKAPYEKTEYYCDAIKQTKPYDNGRRLLDLMDMAVFDFLAGNMDRHHYETFEQFGNFTSPILFDNGRGFGKTDHDELSILAPLYQCCMIRYSTLKKLLTFHQGHLKLSDAMHESMSVDQANPVLLDKHLHAIDRRVAMILRTVYKCTTSQSFVNVVQDDGF